MAVATGDPRVIPFTINATVGGTAVVGQGQEPVAWVLLSTSLNNNPTPVWIDISEDVREFSTSRGRDSELNEFDAGSAAVTLDNRARAYDPTSNSNIRPMNRVWIREQFNGLTNDVFKGYVESINQSWPAPGFSDAVSVLNCVDEFKVLQLDAVPSMNPPVDTYADLVASDNPTSYWRWSDSTLTSTTTVETVELLTWHFDWLLGGVFDTVQVPHTVTGFQDWTLGNGVGFTKGGTSGPIIGDLENIGDGYLNMSSTGPFSIFANDSATCDPMSGTAFTVETWFRKTGNPGANGNFMIGPESTTAGVPTWQLRLNTTGTFSLVMNDSGGTLRTVTSTTALQDNTWYHLVAELDAANLRLFINGVQDNTASSGTGQVRPTNTAGATATILGVAGVTQIDYDETVFYLNTALPVARALAHYQGASKGYYGGNTLGLPHQRANDVLDSVTSDTPRTLRVGTRGMQSVFQHGQAPLDELRKCALAELPNGVVFIAKDGDITLLDAAHRTVSPWNTVQMIFSDQGVAGEWPYENISTDYSDSFITNEWNANVLAGTLVTSSDATSISRYGKRSQTLSDLPLTISNIVLQSVLDSMIVKYKNPMMRILSIDLNCADLDVLDGVFQRELCDKVQVKRALPGGGALNQQAYIQKIDVTAVNDGTPWKVTLGIGDVAFDASS